MHSDFSGGIRSFSGTQRHRKQDISVDLHISYAGICFPVRLVRAVQPPKTKKAGRAVPALSDSVPGPGESAQREGILSETADPLLASVVSSLSDGLSATASSAGAASTAASASP